MSATSQPLEALAYANEIRKSNAQVTKEIRGLGKIKSLERAAEVVREMPGDTGAIPIARLLLSVPVLGEAKTQTVLKRAGVMLGSRKIRDLSDRQRAVIARWLDYEHDRREIASGRGRFDG